MAATREERMQQRLRGAQRRQVKDVDFGLTFAPTLMQPSAVSATVRRNPRRSLELASQLSARPTPSNRSRSQPPIATPVDDNIRPATTHNAVDANTSAKRRKLHSDEASTSQRSTRSSLPSRRDIYALSAEDEAETAGDTTNGIVVQSTKVPQLDNQDASTSMIPQTQERTPFPSMMQEEITESPTHAPGSGHRTRTLNLPAIESTQVQDELQADRWVRLERPASPPPQRKRKRINSIPDTIRSRRSRSRASNVTIGLDDAGDDADELSPEQPRRGRRRRSSIQREPLNEAGIDESPEEKETAEEIEDAEAATIMKKNRSRRHPRHAEPSPDLDEPSERPPVAKKQRSRKHQVPISSPASQIHPRKAPSTAAAKSSKKATKTQTLIGSPIPVTVHRLTRAPTYDEVESDADILNAENPYAKRGSANVIDVLAQVCQEVIASSLETIQEHRMNAQDSTEKRDFRDKHQYVQAFSRELETRLLEHTINLDNNSSLTKRLREGQRKKLALREEILQVRAAREKVALRMDEIRIRHENESNNAQDRDTLNSAIHDIELAVERGKENSPHDRKDGPVKKVGTEMLLKRIAGDLSKKSDLGGMLNQIKHFNAFLERAAMALEGRKA